MSQLLAVRARARSELLMHDTIVFVRGGSGPPVYDPDTDDTAPPVGSTVYSGKCRILPTGGTQGQDVNAADQVVTLVGFLVLLPFSASLVRNGDVGTVTVSVDPSLVGVKLRVAEAEGSTYASSRRLICERDTG